MKIPTTYEEKLAKIESLYPSTDWLYKRLSQIQSITSARLYQAEAAVKYIFEEPDYDAVGWTDEDEARHQRINLIMQRRAEQLSQRQEAIRETFTWDEREQMVIS